MLLILNSKLRIKSLFWNIPGQGSQGGWVEIPPCSLPTTAHQSPNRM